MFGTASRMFRFVPATRSVVALGLAVTVPPFNTLPSYNKPWQINHFVACGGGAEGKGNPQLVFRISHAPIFAIEPCEC